MPLFFMAKILSPEEFEKRFSLKPGENYARNEWNKTDYNPAPKPVVMADKKTIDTLKEGAEKYINKLRE